MKRASLLLPILLALVPPPAAWGGHTPLQPFTAHYEVRRGKSHAANIRFTLRYPRPQRYRVEAQISPVGLYAIFFHSAVEWSEGVVAGDHFHPRRYRLVQRALGDSRDMEMIFDPARGRVEHRLDKHPPWYLKVPRVVEDKLTERLLLSQALARGERRPTMQVADGGGLRRYHYEIVGREWIDTPAGRFQTVKVQRHKGGSPSNATLWLAQKLHYLPVRIDRKRHGTTYHLRLTRVQGR